MQQTAHKVVVIGHRNPDTDSICSAIAYAELKNKTSDLVCESRRAGKMNQETEFVLKKFGVTPPRMCTDVNPKIRDVDYRQIPGIPGSTSLRKAWEIMRDQKIDTLAVTSEEDELQGVITVKDIATANMDLFDTGILAKKLPISIQMGVLAMLLSLVLGIPLGLIMGQYKGRWPDKLGTALIVLIQAVPAAVYFLYIQMYGTAAVGVGLLFNAANWRYWVLPVCSMSLANLAFYAMWLRRYMVDESNKDYVRLARAKGVCGRDIALHHVFRNAMVPLVQYIPSAFLNTVVGSIYIESLYSIPGMGGLLVTCVQRHDNTMVQGIVLLYACVGIVGLILGDILMVLIDPRINFGKKEGGR